MSEEIKNIATGFYEEVINKKNIDAISNYLTEDFIHNGEERGVNGQKEAVKMFLFAFTNLVNTVELSLSEGDMVCVHERWKGIHSGEFMGVKASGRNVEWTSTAILKIRDGKICRAWDENDMLGLFQQIGEYPEIK